MTPAGAPRIKRSVKLAVVLVASVAFGLAAAPDDARADPLRLRGDALAQTRSPTGLLVLQGEDARRPWVSAEALAWLGTGEDRTGDVLTLTVKLRDPEGRAEARAGRFLVATGSVRPLHLDGASAVGRTPWGTSLEAFGGAPVVARFGGRAYDWAAGGRVAQNIAEKANLGVAYVHKRDRGVLADEELGLDFAAAPSRRFDVAARGAYDLVTTGLADALVSIGSRVSDFRFEAFGTRRSPSRLLPATSLFSVLGDVPSTRAGGTAKWYAAPRLDLLASAAAQIVDDRAGFEGSIRATLRTDDEGQGTLGLELRRQGIPGASWMGARGLASVPIVPRLRASTEIEVAAPDDPRGRGDLWPWALVALGWQAPAGWEVAAAAEAASTATARRELVAMVRASFAWGR